MQKIRFARGICKKWARNKLKFVFRSRHLQKMGAQQLKICVSLEAFAKKHARQRKPKQTKPKQRKPKQRNPKQNKPKQRKPKQRKPKQRKPKQKNKKTKKT